MYELPEVPDHFHPCEPEAVPYGTGTATRIGRDVEADILVSATGEVVARLGEDEWLINCSVDQYRRSLVAFAAARDEALAGRVGGERAQLEALERELTGIDSVAYTHLSSYWRPILEYEHLQAG